MNGQPLSLRLAGVLALVVIAVLLVTGVAVNRLVSQSLERELSASQREHLQAVAAAVGEVDWTTPRGQHVVETILFRVANPLHGRAQIQANDGSLLADAGTLPLGTVTDRVSVPIPGHDANLVIQVPRPGSAFLRVFNLTLLIAGALAVAALVIAALVLSERLTRPLRGVTAAARRLEVGDLSARAVGGPDRESGELAGAFNAMADRLERSEMLRRRAASDIAHDLATPATVLESQLQAMLDGIVPADAEQLERARAAAAALSGVVVQMRELVDAEAAAFQRRPQRVAIGALLTEAERALQPLFREREVVLQLRIPKKSPIVEVDQTQVGRALRNVLSNAAQHSPAGAEVVVSVHSQPNGVQVRVADRGTGIAADDLPHIFERFYRGDPSRAGGQSTASAGIGLTIARELLVANGGSIEVESTGPDGTTFRVELPRPG